MTSITPFLWFNNNIPEAVAFYRMRPMPGSNRQ